MNTRRPARKKRSIFWVYLFILVLIVVSVALFALLYSGGGAGILANAAL